MSASAPASVIDADEFVDARVGVAQVEDLLDDGAVLALELGGLAARGGCSSGRSSTSTRRRPSGPVCAAPATPRCRPDRVTALPPPGSRIVPVDLGDGADACVLALVHGHEEHALVVADVDGQGDRHVREDDAVFQGDQQQIRQLRLSSVSEPHRFNH